MISRYTVDVTSQRMQETEQAIAEQRKYLDSLSDPALKAIAARTLATLEDILLIMKRTHGLLTETANGSPCGGVLAGAISVLARTIAGLSHHARERDGVKTNDFFVTTVVVDGNERRWPNIYRYGAAPGTFRGVGS